MARATARAASRLAVALAEARSGHGTCTRTRLAARWGVHAPAQPRGSSTALAKALRWRQRCESATSEPGAAISPSRCCCCMRRALSAPGRRFARRRWHAFDVARGQRGGATCQPRCKYTPHPGQASLVCGRASTTRQPDSGRKHEQRSRQCAAQAGSFAAATQAACAHVGLPPQAIHAFADVQAGTALQDRW